MLLVKSSSEVRNHFKETLDTVCQDHIAIVISRLHAPNVVLISEEDFLALDETAYLLRSRANAKRLKAALARPAKKRIQFKSLKDFSDEMGV